MDDSDPVFVPKHFWQMLRPRYVPIMSPPAKGVVFGFPQMLFAGKGKPFLGPIPDYDACIKELRFMQKMDMMKYPDIKYNFLIGPDDRVYEGRGWDCIPSLPQKLKYLNYSVYYFIFIGDFTVSPPMQSSYILRDKLIQYGIKNNYIKPKHFVYNMRHSVGSKYEPFDFNVNQVMSPENLY